MQFSLFVYLEGNSLCNHRMQRALFTAVANKKSSFITVKTKRTTEKLGSKVYSKPPISVNPSNSSLPFKYSRGQYLIMSSHMIGVTFLPCKCLRMGFMWCTNNSDLFRASLRQTGHVLRFHTWLKKKKKKYQYENAAVLILVMKSFLC